MYWVKKNWLTLLILFLVLLFFIFNNITAKQTETNDMNQLSLEIEPSVLSEETEIAKPSPDKEIMIYVDVKGEVIQPGVYIANSDERVADMIKRAGGFSENANEQPVNLAQKVFDEMVIYVPSKDEVMEQKLNTVGKANGKMRINYASKEEILSLPGIGDVKAEAIIAYRDNMGPFKSVEDLLSVTGIGEKTLEQIRDQIQIP